MNNRNYSIDVLKFVAAMMVVIVHTGEWFGHQALMPMVRSAVPCFFMISGYLLYSRDGIGRDRLVRNVRHIAWMCVWTMALFSVVDVVCMVYTHSYAWPTFKSLRNLILFNDYPFHPINVGGHLWYILAYLYVLLTMVFVERHRLWRWVFVVMPLLWTGYMWLEHHQFPEYTYRNFLFEGIPYFTVGAMVKHWSPCIIGRIDRKLFAGGGGSFLSAFHLY